ncbi:SusC/RagA family TonB-linked outer membrane protein [Polaribacter tangerinus]|uniref:SusC/RagA family TonB-linked outer membrane protein n=1 Tax=Polaribacter tangerinus TaxID=1920034 RepID=UPI000B4B96AE|nr:SusC/RagA family TonB-linked outer membrane protein [Polaribacter tangerinus]
MKTKFKGILTLLLAFVVQISFAQEKTVSGTVSDASGPLPGVSILIKGTTKGTDTDFDGKYSIKASAGDILVYRYLGYETVEKTVGNQTIINITLQEGANVLDEIIVTGLGISKQEKAIGYAVQKVSGENVDKAKEPNIVNSLQGRIAGVQIQGSPSSLGGSTRITIRGSNSFLGNNQPLFIIDGVPISNASYSSQSQQNGFGGGSYDYGNAASDIDPSNVESMSVLKGAAATAIYGSRGANGVILITTKSGKSQKGLGVSFDSSVAFDQVRNLIPIQTTYGGGSTYNTPSGFNEFTQDGVAYLAPNYGKDGSWGPKFDPNVLVRHWDSWDPGSPNYKETRPWVAPKNSYETFFNTGVTLINTLALSGGNEKGSFRAGYTNLDQTGVMPEGKLQRNTVTLNSEYNLTDKLKSSVAFTYVKTEAENRNATGYDNANPLQGFTQWWQSQLDVKRLKNNQNNSLGGQATWNPKGISEDANGNLLSFNSNPNFFDNPSWVRENYLQEDVRNRVFGNANITYQINDKLSFTTQFGTDLFQFSIREGIPLRSVNGSTYSETERRFQETNIEARLNYSSDFGENLTFNGFIGANRMRNFAKRTTIATSGGIVVDKFFNIGNSAVDPTANTFESQRGINSIFASASFGWKDMLFLDLSARNDWSSTLPEENNSYFYPSASLSFAISELDAVKESDFINFAKVRASIAQAGNDSDPYRIADVYNPINPNFGGNTLYNVPNSQQNPNLVNELTTEMEFGFMVKLLQNRLNIDAAYYSRTTEDQIFNVPVSAATGYTSRLLNAGIMKNSGLELQISGTPIKTADFSWDLALNLTSQNNEVVELLKDENGETLVESIAQGSTWAADLRIQEGLPYMALFGQDFKYDSNGNKLVDANGYYEFTDERVFLGSAIADWTGGFSTAFNYKNFTLSALFDFQVGGIIHSTSLQWSKYSGMHPETVSFNGESDVRANGLLLPGVKADGSPNDVRVDPQTYYGNTWRVAAPNVYDASFIKFRDVRLSYNVPKNIIDKSPFTSLTLSAFGRNLGILYSEVPYIDPQVITGSGNAQGLENAQVPPTSTFGFNISAKF